MKVSIKGFITCKSAEQYIDCADNYAVNESSHRFSVSDGVSKSFFPKIWSEILVSQFVERTDLKESELIKVCQDEWQKRIDEIVSLPETKWFTKSQYSRKDPALATFVGLHFLEKEKMWSAFALGDSFLFFVPKGYKDYQKELIRLSSKVEPIVFDNFPDYLTSIGESHKGRAKEKGGNLRNGTFYLMTDALAEWFIKEEENAIGKITVWKSQADFEKFIVQAIDENQLANDDCAILCIELSESDGNGIKYENIQVTDLNDLINDQEAEKEVKFFFSGKEETKQTLPEKKVRYEMQETVEQNSEQIEQTSEELSNLETTLVDNHNAENNKTEVLEKEKVEEETKNDNEKTETEKLEQKEQPKVDSKAKNIFDKF